MISVFLRSGIIVLLPLLTVLTGCTTVTTWLGNMEKQLAEMQKQPVDDFDKRSVFFKPQFNLEKPKRENLSAQEQQLVGAPPPEQGMIILDGTRYYSANGHVCQYFQHKRRRANNAPQPACFIKGKWVKAAPVLNTRVIPR